MTNEEKIRLVLETLGTDSVRQATKELRELQKGLGDVEAASTKAAGKGGVNGQGILQLAYFIDDMQYGIRGVMNNIPQLTQALGLGAGLAGVAGIAAVAVGALVEKHPEWFAWSKKVEEKLKELTDAIKAEEEAVKRQKEAVDKLGESTSKRIEDILKLKAATESLKDAEAQLAEDRKNAKATEEADKNVGAMATEELAKQKEVIKSVITDAGLQKQVRDELTRQIERSTPEITDAQAYGEGSSIAAAEAGPAAWNALSPEAKANLARQNMGKGRATLQNKRNDEIKKAVEGIFGGLMNPANMDELNRSMEGLGKFLPGVAGELRNVYQFDRENESFDAGNDRWRRGGGARRRAAEREFAAGERTGAAMLPNRGMMDEATNAEIAKARFEAEAKDKARREMMADLAGVLPDPVTLAAMRRANAGTGPGAARVMMGLEGQDMATMTQLLMQRGMSQQDARANAGQYLAGGNQEFNQLAESNGMNARNINEGFRAAAQFMQQIQQDQQETQQILQWIQQLANVQQNAGGNVRPQMGRARN